MPDIPKKDPKDTLIGKLRADLQLFPGGRDGAGRETWVVFDPVADRYCKIDAISHAVMMRLDCVQSLGTLQGRLKAQALEMSIEDLGMYVGRMAAGGLISAGYGSDKHMAESASRIKKAIFSHRLLQSYLFLNIPLLRPDAFIGRTVPFMTAVFNKITLPLLAAVAFAGYISLLPKAERIGSVFWSSLSPEGFAGYMVAICLLKVVHEFSHAYVAKANGVRVREMGLAMIVFFPRLYTNVTDAWRIPDRKIRCAIDGAGIAAELIVGGLFAILWCLTPPGILNSISYYLFAVSAINTIFVNGNPFIKYDGYYLLMDLVNIDNLQARANDLLRRRLRSGLLGVRPAVNFEDEKDIQGWRGPFIMCFSVLSALYRIFLYTSIILIVYFQFTKALGIALLCVELYVLIIKPLSQELKAVSTLQSRFVRRNVIVSSIGAAVLAAVFLLPLPWQVSMPCEILPAGDQGVYAKMGGVLKSLPVESGTQVEAGKSLLALENPILDWDERKLVLEKARIKMELDQIKFDPKRSSELQMELKRLEAADNKLSEIKRRKELLSLEADFSGVFQLYDMHLKPGKWLHEGEAVGELFTPSGRQARAFADESEVGKLHSGDRVSIVLDGTLESYGGVVEAIDGAPIKNLHAPSSLFDIYGGDLQTLRDPASTELLFLHPLYRVSIKLDEGSVPPPGRTGKARLHKFSSAGGATIRWIASGLVHEFAF